MRSSQERWTVGIIRLFSNLAETTYFNIVQFPICTILIGGESQNEIERDQILNNKLKFSLFSTLKGDSSYLASKTMKSAGCCGVEKITS